MVGCVGELLDLMGQCNDTEKERLAVRASIHLARQYYGLSDTCFGMCYPLQAVLGAFPSLVSSLCLTDEQVFYCLFFGVSVQWSVKQCVCMCLCMCVYYNKNFTNLTNTLLTHLNQFLFLLFPYLDLPTELLHAWWHSFELIFLMNV